jgi:CubicO group peptidase (beta-lactamase class C family)
MTIMRRALHLMVALLLTGVCMARGAGHYPGDSWESVSNPAKLGWSREKLRAARDYSKTIATEAVFIVVDGRVLDAWGHTKTRYNVHSIRKSFMSALYGIHVHEGHINLSATLAELGIDDNYPSLSAVEKKATLHDLIEARSGVYHPAVYETEGMKEKRPERGSHPPGTFWYYNNWDFNVLGAVFERKTKTNLFAELKARIADPIGMEDFRVADGHYVTAADSIYRAYPFDMTARDMARFGLLFLRGGVWRGKQVVPTNWVKESTRSYSDAGERGGYGYLWWVAKNGKHLPGVELPDGSFSARGSHGHYILVVPAYDLVIVHRPAADDDVTSKEFGKLVRLILQARRE